MMVNAIGIDLGTTFSCVGVVQDGKVKIILSDFGKTTTPSYVAFLDSGTLVGQAARNSARRHPEKTIFNVKRLIGRRYVDFSGQENFLPFKIKNESGFPKILLEMQGETKSLYPEQISALVLKKMKQIAEEFLGEKVTAAVITVPASFNNSQREATKVAGKIAGLEVLQIINEPTAAALAYGHKNQTEKKQKVLIFDFGGGTLDVSIVAVQNQHYKVLATSGNNLLGGEDFTNVLLQYFVAEFGKKHGKDVKSNARATQRLRDSCENAKLDLSGQKEADVEVVFEEIVEVYEITREEFENICRDIFPKIMDPVQRAIDIAKISKSEIEKVILVGGSSRIPKVSEFLYIC
uniref:Heat shock protein 70 n=1 Tax=Panagrolaimus sp. ES5 TaxID=591445 RepID=A0AC34GWA6_9BILA